MQIPNSTNVVALFESFTERLKNIDTSIIEGTSSKVEKVFSNFTSIAKSYSGLGEALTNLSTVNVTTDDIDKLSSSLVSITNSISKMSSAIDNDRVDSDALSNVRDLMTAFGDIFAGKSMSKMMKNMNNMYETRTYTDQFGDTKTERSFFLTGFIDAALIPMMGKVGELTKKAKKAKIDELNDNMSGTLEFVRFIGKLAFTSVLISPMVKLFGKVYKNWNLFGNDTLANLGTQILQFASAFSTISSTLDLLRKKSKRIIKRKDEILEIIGISKRIFDSMMSIFVNEAGRAKYTTSEINAINIGTMFLNRMVEQYKNLIDMFGSVKFIIKMKLMVASKSLIESTVGVLGVIVDFYATHSSSMMKISKTSDSLKDVIDTFSLSFVKLTLCLPFMALSVLAYPVIRLGMFVMADIVRFTQWVGDIKLKPLIKSLGALTLIISTLALSFVGIVLIGTFIKTSGIVEQTGYVLLGILAMTAITLALWGYGLLADKMKGKIVTGILMFGAILLTLIATTATLFIVSLMLKTIDWGELAINLGYMSLVMLAAGVAFALIGTLVTATGGAAAGLIAIGVLASVAVMGSLWLLARISRGVFDEIRKANPDKDLVDKSKYMFDIMYEVAWGLAKAMPGFAAATPLLMLGMPSIMMTTSVVTGIADVMERMTKFKVSEMAAAATNTKLMLSTYTGILKEISNTFDSDFMGFGFIDSKIEDIFETIDATVSPVSHLADLFMKISKMQFMEKTTNSEGNMIYFSSSLITEAKAAIKLILTGYADILNTIATDPTLESVRKMGEQTLFFDSPLEDLFESIESTISPVTKITDLITKVAGLDFQLESFEKGGKRYFKSNLINEANSAITLIMKGYASMVNTISDDETFKNLMDKGTSFFFDSDIEDVFETLETTVSPVIKITDLIEKVSNMEVDIDKASGVVRSVMNSYTDMVMCMVGESIDPNKKEENKKRKEALKFINKNKKQFDVINKSMDGTVTAISKLDISKSDKFIEVMKSMTDFAESFNGNIDKFVDAIANQLVPVLEDMMIGAKMAYAKSAKEQLSSNNNSQPAQTQQTQAKPVDFEPILNAISTLTSELSALKRNTFVVTPDRDAVWPDR